MNDSINLILILGKLLNGHRDLSNYILFLKDKKEEEDKFLESQDFWIENNFYNWLNHDIVIRESMGLHMLEAYSEDKQSQLYEYYQKHVDKLGLVNYHRKRKLSDCFNDKWWKCTPKSYVYWNDIHSLITSKIRVFDIINGYNYGERDTQYCLDNDLLIEKKGIERMKYINSVYKELIIHGGFSFQDVSHIFIQEGIIQFLE
tara:strand:+ start:32 stop:637 length:606 start_codon:yes stop_codon:yes gene_type:complete